MPLFRIVLGVLLAPRQLFALAAFCVAAGLFWGYATVHENANRKLALRQGPPAAVAVEDYRRGANRGPAGEVVLRAVADPDRPLILVMPGTDDRRLTVPLYPLESGESGDGAMGAILLPLAPGETVDPARLAARLGDGIVEVNGRAVDAGDFPLILAGALATEGRFVGARFVAVEPYLDGRDAALQPIVDPSLHWLWGVAAGVLLALVAAVRRFVPGLLRAPRPAPAVSRRAPASPHFPPLPAQEEVAATEAPDVGARLRAGVAATLGVVANAIRFILRGTAALVRLFRAGVGEIRSPR
jgi:hypothetical protein